MPDRALRIVTYNVRYFGHALRGLASTIGPKRRIAAALLTLDPLPDIICMQEVDTISLRSRLAHRGGRDGETQLEAFMGRLEAAFDAAEVPFPYEAFYFRAHTYKLGSTPIYTTGLAALVNVRTLRINSHNVHSPEHITHHHLQRWKSRKQSRICAHLRLEDEKGRPLHVFNTHLSLPTPWSKTFWSQRDKMGFGENQVHEARRLVAFARAHAGAEPFVLCGDFNSPPASPVYRCLTEEAGLLGAQEHLGQIDARSPRSFATAGFMRLRMHLDHLFSGGRLNWLDLDGTARFGDPAGRFHGLSDHVPLVGRFSLA
ncbi:MAG: endonuclease/exonuclease/phosphatase family protein [Myxococcales bacterium]|nr:endonuclease/exonuclease/phosphatase family protein [Myxococcales bacterium]